jgi:hypothetical protein
MADVHTDFSILPKLFSKPNQELRDGVPTNLTYMFTRTFGPDVSPFFLYRPYYQYGILTQNGMKYYFEIQEQAPAVMKILICPQDTKSIVKFRDCRPDNIKDWKATILNTAQQQELQVFYIKNPNDYFKSTWFAQNMWPMGTALVSQCISIERNPYFI